MAKYLVIGIQSYDFKDETSGRNIKGTSVFFLDKAEPSNSFIGYKTGKISVPANFSKAFTVLPGFYDLDFAVKVGSAGKVSATVESVKFLSTAKITEEKPETKVS